MDDVVIDGGGDGKTRAYDFVLPYKVADKPPVIFIQSQFYAGDSGSVSHKVVDQTKASRPHTSIKFPAAVFLELLDGAGYYSALNGDLKHMIGMETTSEFIQLRSANIKLRRELQKIGFLTLLEVELAVFKSSDQDIEEIKTILSDDGYSQNEISRLLSKVIEKGLIKTSANKLLISNDRVQYARRYLVIDAIAIIGEELTSKSTAKILIPGYGPYYGVSINELSKYISKTVKSLNYSRDEFADDMTWLSEKKYTVLT